MWVSSAGGVAGVRAIGRAQSRASFARLWSLAIFGRRGAGTSACRDGTPAIAPGVARLQGELRSPASAGVPTRHAESVRHVNRPNRNEIARLQSRLKSRLRAELPAPRCKKYVNRPNRDEIARLRSRLKSRLRAELPAPRCKKYVNRPNRNEIARLQNRLKSRLRAELPAPRCKKYVNRPNRNEIARLQSRLKSRLRAELVVGLFEIHSAFAWASGCAFACGTIRAWLRRSEKYGKKCVAAQLGMPSSGYGVQGDQR